MVWFVLLLLCGAPSYLQCIYTHRCTFELVYRETYVAQDLFVHLNQEQGASLCLPFADYPRHRKVLTGSRLHSRLRILRAGPRNIAVETATETVASGTRQSRLTVILSHSWVTAPTG